MASRRPIRVYPDGDVWVVKKDGTDRASAVVDTKRDALIKARRIALKQDLTIIIHGSDGRIQRTVRPEEGNDNDCFLTTACTRYYGLPDDCYELKTLRRFRDRHLRKSTIGAHLVEEYYSQAPDLVRRMELRPDKHELYRIAFQQIQTACRAIEQGRMAVATAIYIEAVNGLKRTLA